MPTTPKGTTNVREVAPVADRPRSRGKRPALGAVKARKLSTAFALLIGKFLVDERLDDADLAADIHWAMLTVRAYLEECEGYIEAVERDEAIAAWEEEHGPA